MYLYFLYISIIEKMSIKFDVGGNPKFPQGGLKRFFSSSKLHFHIQGVPAACVYLSKKRFSQA